MSTTEETVRVDVPRVRQALVNMFDNARTHGADPVAVAAERHGDRLRLEVTDRGPGFPPEVLQAAFEPFRRGRSATGSGLGLAIVQAVAEAHGGHASVGNRPGGGAFVRIEVPV